MKQLKIEIFKFLDSIDFIYVKDLDHPNLLVKKSTPFSTILLQDLLNSVSPGFHLFISSYGDKLDLEDFRPFFGLVHGTTGWDGESPLKIEPSVENSFSIGMNYKVLSEACICLFNTPFKPFASLAQVNPAIRTILGRFGLGFGFLEIDNLPPGYRDLLIDQITLYWYGKHTLFTASHDNFNWKHFPRKHGKFVTNKLEACRKIFNRLLEPKFQIGMDIFRLEMKLKRLSNPFEHFQRIKLEMVFDMKEVVQDTGMSIQDPLQKFF